MAKDWSFYRTAPPLARADLDFRFAASQQDFLSNIQGCIIEYIAVQN
jgi:hypothetical protein